MTRRQKMVIGGTAIGVLLTTGAVIFLIAKRDRVVLLNNIGNDISSVLVLDTRTGRLCEEKADSGVDVVEFDGLLDDANLCKAEVAVFSGQNAFKIQKADWTDDEEELNLGESLEIPIAVWVLYVAEPQTWENKKREIDAHFKLATALFGNSLCGVHFKIDNVTDLRDKVEMLGEAAQLALLQGKCDFSQRIMNLGYKNGALNVYYTRYPGAYGLYCGPLPRCDEKGGADRIILVSSTALNDTVAHELGHAMVLCHVQGQVDGMPRRNLMTERSNRTGLTEGQCFRANLERESIVKKLGSSAGARDCPRAGRSSNCPELAFDQVVNP